MCYITGEKNHNLFFIEILNKLMNGSTDDSLSPKYGKQLRIQTKVMIKQMKSNDISGDLLYGATTAYLFYSAYKTYYYQNYRMIPGYLIQFLVANYHAKLNNQAFITTMPAITLAIMYVKVQFLQLLDTFDDVYRLYRTRIGINAFRTNWDRVLLNVVNNHMSVTQMSEQLNSGLKYFFALIYFFGSLLNSLMIIIIIYAKYNNNLLIKYLCAAFVVFGVISMYLPTLMAASLSKSGHQFYKPLNSLICRFHPKIQIRMKVRQL